MIAGKDTDTAERFNEIRRRMRDRRQKLREALDND